jgi:imidazolonepropionase-like amidohydrolase
MSTVFLHGERLFDGERVITDGAALIKDGTVREVGPAEEVTRPDRPDSTELRGETVLPGLVDAHVHLTYTETTLRNRLEFSDPRNSLEYNTIESLGVAAEHLEKGVTAIRDIGSRRWLAVAIRDAVEDGLVAGPRIAASGPILTVTGGLTDLYPEWIDATTEFVRHVSGPAEAREAAREQIKAGVDNVKIEASGEWINPYSDSRTPTASPEELAAVVDTAHARGVRVAAHAKAAPSIENALDAGVDTIEHGTFLDEGLMKRMREQGVPLVTTLTCYRNVLRRGTEAYPDERVEVLRREMDQHTDTVRRASELGVQVAAGTDTGPPFSAHGHGAVADEIVHLIDVGLSPREALQAATTTAATAAGLEGTAGRLAPERHGDALLVDGNPLEDPTVLQDHDRITHVLKDGSLVKSPDD